MKTKHTKSIVSTTTTSTPHSALSTPHSEEKGLPSRPEQPRTDTASGDTSAFSLQPSAFPSTPHSAFRAPHSIDFARRWANRQLGTQALLSLLRTEAPRFYPLAEVVGKWVWIQFADKQPPEVTRVLAQLGFHWNNKRQLWQHPCGDSAPRAPQSAPASQPTSDSALRTPRSAPVSHPTPDSALRIPRSALNQGPRSKYGSFHAADAQPI